MAVRKIVQIDEQLCDGCGECVPSCAEGAIQVVGGKARLVKDQYCDGLGACLGECPRGAITVIEREAAAFDEGAVADHLARPGARPAAHAARESDAPAGPLMAGCPGTAARQFAAPPAASSPAAGAASALRQWPIQLHLVSPLAPYYRDADLLLAADCAAFACGDFHARYLEGRALAIACPKLDDPSGYVETLAAMIRESSLRSITIAMMQVPCCRGLEHLAAQAMAQAGREVPVRRVIVGIEGNILRDEAA
ncbi:MAG: 4Fe-4S binding protein [Armatimonadetes bacterium]|nr:4Fe-4S binding protein [Armatimonadota bacterium]